MGGLPWVRLGVNIRDSLVELFVELGFSVGRALGLLSVFCFASFSEPAGLQTSHLSEGLILLRDTLQEGCT